MEKLSVRELTEADITLICSYWTDSDHQHMEAMGVDVSKIPSQEDLTKMLTAQLNTPIEQKRSFCLIWEIDGKPSGHCNTNPTHFGDYGYMHLHLWKNPYRKKGLGEALVKMSIPHYFEKLQLENLYCEPYALNPAPNKTVEKAGFELEKEYVTVPGPLNFEQPVKLWRLTRQRYEELYS